MGTHVLFVPGAGCPASMFNAWEKVLEKDNLEASTMIFPGHAPGENPGKISLCRSELAIRNRLEKTGPAVLVGHSMGAHESVCAAESNPSVQALILLSPAPMKGIFMGWTPVFRLLSKWKYQWALLTGSAVEFDLEDTRDLFLNGRKPVDALGVEHKFIPESGLALRQLALGEFGVDPTLIKCPVYVLCGTEDRLIDPKVQKRIATYLGAEFQELPGTSHMPMFDENQGQIIELIRNLIHVSLKPKPVLINKAA